MYIPQGLASHSAAVHRRIHFRLLGQGRVHRLRRHRPVPCQPLDSAIEAVPVSFHGQLRKNVYTGSCDIPGVLQCDDLCVIFRGDESTDVYCRDQAYSEPTPIHSITLDRTERCAEIRLWSEYTVEGDHVLATFDPLMHPTLTVTE